MLPILLIATPAFTYVIKFCPFVTGTLAELLVKAVMALELPYE